MIPISPVRETCVPPQSSVEKAGCKWSGKPSSRAGAGSHGFNDAHQAGHDRRVVQHGAIGDVLDTGERIQADRLLMGKIETQPAGSNERPFLRYMFAEHLAERLVQKMRRRMVGAYRLPAFVIDN